MIRLNVPRPGSVILIDGSRYPCKIINAARRGAQLIIDVMPIREFILIDPRAGTKRPVRMTRWEEGKVYIKYLDGHLQDGQKALARLQGAIKKK